MNVIFFLHGLIEYNTIVFPRFKLIMEGSGFYYPRVKMSRLNGVGLSGGYAGVCVCVCIVCVCVYVCVVCI